MNKEKYITNTFYYTALPLLRNALSFVTLPIMTRFLSPNDYGILALIGMITSFSGMFFLGLNNATFRFYFKYKDDLAKLRELFSTCLAFIIASIVIYGLLIVAAYPFLNSYFFKNKLSLIWILMAFAQFALSYINIINQYIYQNQHEGKKWFLNELLAVAIQIPLSIILVLTRQFTFESIIIAGFAAEGVKFVLLFFQLRKYYAFVFRYPVFKESFGYSWPQVPTSLISFGYSYLDRILLSRFQGLSQVGILDMSSRIGSILKMSMDGIGGTLSPLTLELLTTNTKESLKKLADLNLKIIFLVLFSGLSLILFTKEFVILLTTHEYHFIIYIAPIYVYYHIFGVLGMIAYWLIYYHSKYTFWQIPINVTMLVCNTVANIILIPRYGVIGAAIATFISSGIVQSAQFFIGMRLTPIPMKIYKIVLMFLLLFSETGALYVIYYFNVGLFLGIFIKLLMLLIFIQASLFMGVFTIAEAKEIITGFKNRIQSKLKLALSY